MTSSMFHSTISQIGIVTSIVHLILIYLNALQLFTWFLLFFLSCYSISYRISILITFIDNFQSQNVAFDLPKDLLQKLRVSSRLVDQICQSSKELNSIFSLPVLVILTTLLTFSATSLFMFIHLFTTSDALHAHDETPNYEPMAIFAVCILMVLSILIPAGFPVSKVKWAIAAFRIIEWDI